MSRPRVIFVNRVYWPDQAATAQLLTDLAEGLALRGWPVHVIAAGEGDAIRNGVVIHRTGGDTRHRGLISRALGYRQFIRQARQFLANLVQPGDRVVALTDPPMLGTRLARIVEAREAQMIHWVQDIYPEIVAAHAGAFFALPMYPLKRQRNAAWQSAHTCVALGEAMARTVREQRVPPDRVTIIPNWAPRGLQDSPSAAAVAAQRQAWGLGEQVAVVYSGNLGRVHEFDTVLRAAELLRAENGIVFLLVGHGPRLEQVRAAVQTRRLANVRFLPPEPRENLAVALGAADVQLVTLKPAFTPLVYPSKLAGVLAAARPVLFVGGPDEEIPSLLSRYDCGESVAPGDGRKLADLLIRWQKDPGRRLVLGRQARTAYENLFTFDAALTQWEAVLGGAVAPV